MDQTNALADALLKTPSILGGLLSQMNGMSSGDNLSQEGLFSNLVTQSSNVQSSMAALTQTASTSAVTASTSSSTSSFPSVTPASSTAGLMQNLGTLSSTLHKVLVLLHQQSSHDSSTQNGQNKDDNKSTQVTAPSQNQGSTTATAATTSSPTTPDQTSTGSTTPVTTMPASAAAGTSIATTAAAATDAGTGDKSDGSDLKKLTDIVAELLLLTQSMMQNLHQLQTATAGGTSSAKTDAQTAALSSDAVDATANALTGPVSAALQAAISSGNPDALFAALLDPAVTSAATTAATSTDATIADAATALASATTTATGTGATQAGATDPLLQLFNILQKTVQQLVPVATVLAKAAATTGTGAAALTTNAAALTQVTLTAADILPKIDLKALTAEVDATIKADLASAQNNYAATPSGAAPATTAAPDLTAQLSALDTNLKDVLSLLQSKPGSDPATKAIAAAAQVTTDPLAALSTRTPPSTETSKPAPASDTLQSQLFAAPSASSAQPAPTSGQVFANSAATIMAAEKNTGGGFSSTDDTMSHDTASAFSASNNSTNVTAEGAQATGTYSFASQLSAFRAVNGGSVGLPSVVDQVILQMNRSVKSGNDQMSLQLQPGDLGKITVKLDFGSDGKVQGTVTAENPKTLDMLQKDSRSLERALQDAGLRADPGSLQFSFGGQSNQNNAGQTAAQNADGQANGTEDATSTTGDGDLVDLGAIAETYYITPGGVNIRV